MRIESLKQQARRHEQKEEWQKALDQYRRAIREPESEDQTDIGLLNRVGDLFVRVGNVEQAVRYYEQAVDLYREADLPNNAIAICKKIIRNVPSRHQAYLKIGQIRAEQGFLPDARTNFLTYAERMQRGGDLDESFRALVEFCDLAPDDVEVRITVADQMVASRRDEEALEQLLIAYSRLTETGETERADEVGKKIRSLDPNADLAARSRAHAESETEIGVGSEPRTSGVPEDLASAAERFVAGAEHGFDAPEDEARVEGRGYVAGADEDDEEGAFDLPIMAPDDEEAAEEESEALPMMSFEEGGGSGEEEATGLSTLDFGSEQETVEVRAPGDRQDRLLSDIGASRGGPAGPAEDAAADVPAEPRVPAPPPAAEARSEPLQAASSPPSEPTPTPGSLSKPVAPSEASGAPRDEGEPPGGYVDLGAMILGGTNAGNKSTRFQVAYEEPSGDEEADFEKMLSRFKEKVSENIDSADVRAHYDLGTAYKEMGLLEEAISAFQAALRASADHLPTYELMGQTFIEMGRPEAAVRALQRALKVGSGVEDEFVGIYYYLAKAYEALDHTESAVEYYDRVFSLDINFADVTERLRELR